MSVAYQYNLKGCKNVFDFKLTDSGDLDESMALPISKFNLGFHLTNYALQRINFFITVRPGDNNIKTHQQRLSFKFTVPEDYQYKQKNIEDTDEIIQAIRIALKTEIGDTYDYDIGSTLYQTKHTIYKSDED